MRLQKLFISFLRRYFNIDNMACPIILGILVPVVYIFEMTVIKPELLKLRSVTIAEYAAHMILAVFLLINVAGNMMMSLMMDNRLLRSRDSGEYCEKCMMLRPADAWHCPTCKVCILRRDHHCVFLSRCIGLYNHRYYLLYLGYIAFSMAYALAANLYYVSSKFDDIGAMTVSFFRLLNPIFRLMMPEPIGAKEGYMFIIMINVMFLFWSSVLFVYHLRNALLGVTTHQKTRSNEGFSNWRYNLQMVFGTRWYWAVWLPFAYSPIPEYKVK